MKTLLLAVLTTCSFLPGLILRYIPFASMINEKQKKILNAVYGAVLLINIAVVYQVCNAGFNMITFAKVDMTVFGMAMALINILVIRKKIREHLFTYGLVVTCNYMILTFVTYLVYRLQGLSDMEDYIMEIAGFCILSAFCFPLLRRMVERTITPFLTMDSGDYWNTVWFIPIAFYMACLLAVPAGEYITTMRQLLSRVSLNFATVAICQSIAKDHVRMRERLELDEQLLMQKAHYAELTGQVQAARKAKHDLKHHMAAVYRYIEQDDKSGLKDYCDHLMIQDIQEFQIPYTGNAAADGVLYRCSQMAHQNQVRFEMAGTIRSQGIADVDLCVMLGNALDNAMNGCLTVSENRFISLVTESTDQLLTIMLQNSFDGVVQETESGEVLSRRRGDKPGIGLASMRSVCEKYGGSMETQYDQTTFTVLLLLPLKG